MPDGRHRRAECMDIPTQPEPPILNVRAKLADPVLKSRPSRRLV